MAHSKLPQQRLRSDAATVIRKEGNIRERVRALTLRALRGRGFEPAEMKAVLSAVTEGIVEGAAKKPDEVREALSQAFSGLDEAVGKAAEASHLALRELVARARDINDHEMRQAIVSLQRMEKNFLSAVRRVARTAQPKVRRELHDILTHAQRTGTDTGSTVAAILSKFSTTTRSIVAESTRAGIRATHDVGTRFAELASGLLAGMTDAARAPGMRKTSSVRRQAVRRIMTRKK